MSNHSYISIRFESSEEKDMAKDKAEWLEEQYEKHFGKYMEEGSQDSKDFQSRPFEKFSLYKDAERLIYSNRTELKE